MHTYPESLQEILCKVDIQLTMCLPLSLLCRTDRLLQPRIFVQEGGGENVPLGAGSQESALAGHQSGLDQLQREKVRTLPADASSAGLSPGTYYHKLLKTGYTQNRVWKYKHR